MISLLDNLLEYDIPVRSREDHKEPGTDEDDSSQLHVSKHHPVHPYVIGQEKIPTAIFFIFLLSTCRCWDSGNESAGDEVLVSDDDAEVGKQVSHCRQDE